MDRVMWRGSTPPTAAPQAAPWRQSGRRTATSTARSLCGNLARRTAWAARPQAATAQDTSAGASWPIGGGRGSVSLCLTLSQCHTCCFSVTESLMIILQIISPTGFTSLLKLKTISLKIDRLIIRHSQPLVNMCACFIPASPAVPVPPRPWRRPGWAAWRCWQSSKERAKVRARPWAQPKAEKN